MASEDRKRSRWPPIDLHAGSPEGREGHVGTIPIPRDGRTPAPPEGSKTRRVLAEIADRRSSHMDELRPEYDVIRNAAQSIRSTESGIITHDITEESSRAESLGSVRVSIGSIRR